MQVDEPKTYWFINQYASTLETGMGGRHYYLAKELAKQGHNVYLIAAGYTHLLRKRPKVEGEFEIEKVAGFKFVWVEMPPYVDAHDKKRVFNWFRFTWKLLKLRKVIPDRPNAILYSSPSLIPFLGAERLAKYYNAKLVWDIRDIWPLTMIELGGLSPKHPFIMFNQWVEDRACEKSDFITSNWPYAIKHLVTRGANRERFMWIPNGFSAEEFYSNTPLGDEKTRLIPKNKFIVGYTGTLGKANAIDVILDVALLLKVDSTIHFVLVGSGNFEKKILNTISKYHLTNITLIPPVSKKQIPAMLANFDVCYVGFNKSDLYRFGNSLNKLPEYFMSGKPIIYSIDSSFKPVDDANAGITVPAEDSQSIVDAIWKLKFMSPEQRASLGENGYDYALKNYDYALLAKKMEKILLN